MTSIIGSRSCFFTFALLLAAAILTTTWTGGDLPVFGAAIVWGDASDLSAHSPTFPPDPWEDPPPVMLAHSPTFPPDPWEDPPPAFRSPDRRS